MRIFVVIYEFPPVGGGGGRAAQDLCKELVKRNHELRILTAHMKGLPRQESDEGMKIIRVPSARRTSYRADLFTMFGFIFAGSWAGLRHVRAWKPDIIHVHFAVPSGPVAWLLSRITNIPYVLTAHLGDVPGGVPEKTAGWFRWIYPVTPSIWRNATQVTAVSEYTRQLALRSYPVNIRVIPNGVDTRQLDPGSIKVNNPPQIVFAGRFVHQKNPLQLVKTLAQLKHLDWNCVMLGDGPLHASVIQEIQKQGIESRFILPGWVTPEEVIQWLSKSDILFMPSYSEGLPVVGVQSLASGLAIVASKIGGFADLVEDGKNGYLVPVDDLDGFVILLTELISGPTRLQEFRIESRRKSQDFDIRKVAGMYEALFQSSIKSK